MPVAIEILYLIVHHTLTNYDTAPWWMWFPTVSTLASVIGLTLGLMVWTYDFLNRAITR